MISPPDFVAVARAMRASGYRVTSAEDLDAAIAALNLRSGPMPIDLRRDPEKVRMA